MSPAKPQPAAPQPVEPGYDEAFYQALHLRALNSARAVCPFLKEMLHPVSVVDVGCGSGAWLSAFGELGLTDLTGIEGNREAAIIPGADSFGPMMLADLSLPLDLGRTFSLALSLEVAEHLPESSAETFVSSLTRLAPVIVFSAAIPFQRGTSHVNLQWPHYWAGLFWNFGYSIVDCLRPVFWTDDRIDVWYRQNMVVFVDHSRRNSYPALNRADPRTPTERLAQVHPVYYSWLGEECEREISTLRSRVSALESDLASLRPPALPTIGRRVPE